MHKTIGSDYVYVLQGCTTLPFVHATVLWPHLCLFWSFDQYNTLPQLSRFDYISLWYFTKRYDIAALIYVKQELTMNEWMNAVNTLWKKQSIHSQVMNVTFVLQTSYHPLLLSQRMWCLITLDTQFRINVGFHERSLSDPTSCLPLDHSHKRMCLNKLPESICFRSQTGSCFRK